MSGEQNNSFFVQLPNGFFTQFGKQLSALMIKKGAPIPFKENPQFPVLVDILSRKDSHHARLILDLMPKFHSHFLEAFLQHLSHDQTPHSLKEAELIYLDINYFGWAKSKLKTIEKDFEAMRDVIDNSEKNLLFAFSEKLLAVTADYDSEASFVRNQLESLITHPNCRILLLSDGKTSLSAELIEQFIPVTIHGMNETEIMAILKQQRNELEHYHHVIIPEELLTHAYTLAERYLSASHTLEKALLLLDSSAARAHAVEQIQHNSQFKPVLTYAVLTNVLANWTQIPASNIQAYKFKIHDFTQSMQQKIYGQDAAIFILGKELQHLQAQLEKFNKPLASFIFAGPKHTGKHAMAVALAEQLYKQPNVLFYSQPGAQTLTSIVNLKLKRATDKHYSTLKNIIQNTPHAIIVLDYFDTFTPAVLDELIEILSTGYLYDDQGNELNFRHAILLMYTTYGTNRLLELTNQLDQEDEEEQTRGADLLQLVMNEQKRGAAVVHDYSPEEFVEAILPELSTLLPPALMQYAQIVPFVPLNKPAIEKIIGLKLKQLTKALESRYSIEFGYAAEVVRYLVDEIMRNQEVDKHHFDIDKAFKPLYQLLEQTILSQADNKNRPNQLFLQLNETGQALRCDWIAMAAMEA